MEPELKPGDSCQDCQSKGVSRKLRVFHINFNEQIIKCESDTCMYPFSDDFEKVVDQSVSSNAADWLDEILGYMNEYDDQIQVEQLNVNIVDLPATTTTQSNKVESPQKLSIKNGESPLDSTQKKICQSQGSDIQNNESKKVVDHTEKIIKVPVNSIPSQSGWKLVIPKANITHVSAPLKKQKTFAKKVKSPKVINQKIKQNTEIPEKPTTSVITLDNLNDRSPTAYVLSLLKKK